MKKIKAGEEITINYFGSDSLMGMLFKKWRRDIFLSELPFDCKCELCEKVFRHSNSLKYHLQTHADAKSFKCEFCAKKFNQKCNLERIFAEPILYLHRKYCTVHVLQLFSKKIQFWCENSNFQSLCIIIGSNKFDR